MSTYQTWPAKWGMISDLRKCVGRTIEAANLITLPYGCTWDSAWVVRFTDQTRAFFVGGVGSGVISPTAEALKGCPLITPEEYGELAVAEKRQSESQEKERIERMRREFESLKKQLGQA